MATQAEDAPEEIVAVEGDDAAAPELTEAEQIASEMGWKPESEYTGPKEKWKPARDYILTERDVTKTLKETVKDLKGTVDRLTSTSAKQTERALQAQAAEYERRLEQAVEDGDKEAAREARKGLAATERQIEKVVNSPEESFASENPWYGKDDDATAYAVSISQREAAKGASMEQQLKAAAEGVRKRFPELFEDEPKRTTLKAPPSVNAPQSRSTSPRRGSAFADLPPDAKAAAGEYADLFVRKGFVKTKEEALANYARDYFANEAA